MKLLSEILYKAGIDEIFGSTRMAIENLHFDSRNIKTFGLFIAVKGLESDGHQFIDKAIENGAIAVVCETLPKILKKGITYVKVLNSRLALSEIAANYYDHPSSKIHLIGITGTNGKTTTATLLYQLFKRLGYKTGLISTVVNRVDTQEIPSTHTTPDPIALNQLLQKMVDKKCTYCFMEVSSHSLDQFRVHALQFRGAVFTNITHDHLDYHKTFDNYIKAKKVFFDILSDEAFALVNKDDKHWNILVQNSNAKVYTYAVSSLAEYRAKIIENTLNGLNLIMDGKEIWLRLTGKFNTYNALAVYATADLLGIDREEILVNLSMLEGAEGRFQMIKNKSGKTVIVDYAHTPDALEKILLTINDSRNPDQKLYTVVGCGGNRDAFKRPKMGKIAAQLSDKVILTSDNPRNEKAEDIVEQMKTEIPSDKKMEVISILDRKEAIKTAIEYAGNKDIVLIAGKGHEKYQEINGVKHPFDDVEMSKQFLKD